MLKHPGAYDAGGGITPGPYLPPAEDNNRYTVMSYTVDPDNGLKSDHLMPYDIAALQQRFGANMTTATGSNVYTGPSSGYIQTIWDAGGTDTFDGSAIATEVTIDLREGGFSSIGATNNLAIAYGVVIENATGGAGNDTFYDNTANNFIQGNGGTDTVVFSGLRSAYTLTDIGGGNVRVVGPDGTDTLSGIEKLTFNDQTVTWQSNSTSHVSTDFDGNGNSDILLQNNDGSVAIWDMNDKTIATAAVVVNPGATWHAIATGFFNTDAKSDILLQNNDGSVAIWDMNDKTVATAAVVANPGVTWHAVGTGDFDGNGNSDILLQNNDGSVAIWDMNDKTVATAAVVVNPGLSWHAIATGFFNTDAKSDILLQNNDGSIAIWEMNDKTTASAAVVANPGATWHAVGTGDFNHDSISDIVLQNTNGSVAIWDMNDKTIASAAVVANPGPTWHLTGVGDYNHDTVSDLRFQNDDGSVAIWDMNDTTIASAAVIANPGTTWHLTGDNWHI
jgi:hypothetical protein